MILKYGDRGINVIALQHLLNYFGDDLKADGIFGEQTDYAVSLYQSKNNLEVDGIVGPKTLKTMQESDKLLEVLILVESGGKDGAMGDLGLKDKAYGCLQIRQGVVDTVNKKLGLKLKSQDCLDNRIISLLIWFYYWKVYSGRDDEDRARSWNGGAGWRKFYGKKGKESYTKNLDLYWSKVKKLLV